MCINGSYSLSGSIKRSVKKVAATSDCNLSKVLGTVDFENGFHFFTEETAYTGITARSLFEFVEKLEIVNVQSLRYHLRRRDFQNWITDVMGDRKLSKRLSGLDKALPGEGLRNEIVAMVQGRIRELQESAGKRS